MEIIVTKFTKSVGKGKTIGFGDVVVNNCITLRGVTLVKSDDGGTFCSPPREKTSNGKYYDKGFSWVFEKKQQTEESVEFMNAIKNALEKAAEEEGNSGGKPKPKDKKSW